MYYAFKINCFAGLIYVIDSNDRERFAESFDELTGILSHDEMRGVPVVVLANKQDMPNAASCSDIADALQLHKLRDRLVIALVSNLQKGGFREKRSFQPPWTCSLKITLSWSEISSNEITLVAALYGAVVNINLL